MDGIPFGRYQLLSLLGRGGMGEVWRAFDTQTKRIVAVKVLPEYLAADPVFEARFRREAEAVASLTEPHVVPVHHFGEIDGRLYLDMRLIIGRDLASMLSDGPLQPTRAVMIVEQVASALQAAHLVGLVHRDVKPSNILVADADFAYLIDFGIARVAGETGLTSTGSTLGTWAYMAPERFSSADPDSRSDVYALACVLYECLTGQRPFLGDNVEQQVAGHLTTPPPRPSATAGVPVVFDDVIKTGMAKNPDERYSTTTELAAGARAALSGTDSPSFGNYPADAPTAHGRPSKLPPGADPRAPTQSAPSAPVDLPQTPSPSATMTARRPPLRALIGVPVVAVLLIFLAVGLLWRPWQHPQSTTTASSSSSAPTTPTPAGAAPAVVLPDEPPPNSGCSGAVVGHSDTKHPQLGMVRVFLFFDGTTSTGPHAAGCALPVTHTGRVLPAIGVDAFVGTGFGFANPATDITGNMFIRYQDSSNSNNSDGGVIVLVPSTDGFEDVISYQRVRGDSSGYLTGVNDYYSVELIGPVDGVYAIRQTNNTCNPDCAAGNVTVRNLHWNGKGYVPDA